MSHAKSFTRASRSLGRAMQRAGLVIGLLGLTSTAGLAVAGAQEAPASEATTVCEVVTFDELLINSRDRVRETAVRPINLPAGVIDIPSATSFDGYPARVNITQPSERWDLAFIGADGSIVGVSAPTPDLEDFVEEVTWTGPLGTVELSAPAVGVKARHRFDLPSNLSPDSVFPSGAEICFEQAVVVPPTTAPPTTAPPTTAPPTTAPPTTAPPTTVPTCTDANGDQVPVTDAGTDTDGVTCCDPAAGDNVDADNPDSDGNCNPPPPAPPATVPSTTQPTVTVQGSTTLPSTTAVAGPSTTEVSTTVPSSVTVAAETTIPPPSPPTSGLPVTGSATMLLTIAGAALLAAGALTSTFARRAAA